MRLHPKVKENFPFNKNDVVLAKYDNEVFYAKIVLINYKREYAKCLFDDGSREDIPFQNIFDVNETTSDIICVVCKRDATELNNDIVLCDNCNVGFHQKCHEPVIPSDVLKPEAPWKCVYCSDGLKNPYVESNPFNENEAETKENNNKEEKEGFQEDIKPEEEIENKIEETKTKKDEIITDNLVEKSQCNISKESVTTLEDVDNNLEDSTQQSPQTYGEQVVIAHADSTSNDDLIIDIVNENSNSESQVVIQEVKEKVEETDKVEVTCPQEASKTVKQQNKERYLKDFPNHNWLLERLKTEKKLNSNEIEKIEQTVYRQHKQETQQHDNHDFMKKFLLEKKSKNLKLDLNNNNSSMKTTIVIPTANLVHSTTTKVKTPVTPCTENPIFVKKRESPDGKSIDIPARPVVELNIPKITKEFFSNVKPSSPNMCAQSKQTKIEFPSNNNHIKIKRQISDIRHSRPVPQIFSPSISPPISSYRPSRSPTSPLEETKTKIYRPEDIERCLMNVSPVEHSKFVYHQPVYRETRETTIYPIAEDVFTEVQDIRRVHHRPSFPYYRDRKSPCKSRLHSESSVELPQRSRLQCHPFFEPKETERYPKNIEKSTAKHAYKRLLSETKYDSQPKHLTTLKRPSSGDSYHDIPLKRRSPASVSSPLSTVYHHPSTIPSPNTRTSSFPRSQEVYYRKEEFFVCSPTNSKSPKSYQQQELKKTQPKELKTLKNHNCLSCGRPAQLLCSACRLVRYCSRKCQLDDWKDHLYQCNIKK